MLAAAVGVPYTASETELGRTAMQSITSKSASLQTYVASSGEGAHAHRDVERILETGIDKYRYASTPLVIAGQAGAPVATSAAGATGTPALPVSTSGGLNRAAAGPAALLPTPGIAPGTLAGGALVGGPVHDLREVLRFDISPDWVTAKFARVTTVLAETDLEGLRVPLVTGIGPTDLAGSITYYFDYSGKLQRVMLHGFTGDVSRIVETMTQHYGLQAEASLDAGVYTRRWNGQPVHFLRLTRAPVVYSDALHHKFTVYLELNQPDLRYGISPEAALIIQSDRRTGRW
jgi:hypothetical protein